MTNLRTAAQQALEAMDKATRFMSDADYRKLNEAIDALRAALAQQAEPVAYTTGHCENHKQKGGCQLHNLQCGWPDCDRKPTTAPPQQAEPFTPDAIRTTQTAWKMGYDAAKAETQQAGPVYWEVRCTAHPKWMRVDEQQFDEYVSYGWEGQRLYTAPPPRKPLTDEEILEAVGWERAEMYMKLTPNFPVEEARKETLKNARAVEAKHCIKE